MGYLSTRLDQLAFKPDLVDESDNTQDYLIFLIGGNPGLISYYEPFLSTLHALLSASAASESAQFYFYANSLAGFENAHLANGQEATGPVGLQQQIENTERLIINRIRLHQKETETETETKDNPPKVILMGHSVGAYILLEIICRHKETVDTGLAEDFDLIGGILLFPTIVNIAKSPMGIFASVGKPDCVMKCRLLIFIAILEITANCTGCWCYCSILGKCSAGISTLPHHQNYHEIP